MIPEVAIENYRNACNAWDELILSFDEPDHRRKIQQQRKELEHYFQNLFAFAETNNPPLWHVIGTAYNTARGTARNRQEAMRWYLRAADAGFAPAMVTLGLCLMYPPPPADAQSALRWFRKAAEKGYAGAMVRLGFAYRDGDGVPSDFNEAVQWFTKAVEAGDSNSMIHVGRMYARYLSSPALALEWFLRAADSALGESFIELARLYENRESEVYNPAEAHKWFRVAAEYSEGRSTAALFAIARQYLQGLGAPCNVENARWWLNRILFLSPPDSGSRKEATRMLKKLDGQIL